MSTKKNGKSNILAEEKDEGREKIVDLFDKVSLQRIENSNLKPQIVKVVNSEFADYLEGMRMYDIIEPRKGESFQIVNISTQEEQTFEEYYLIIYIRK